MKKIITSAAAFLAITTGAHAGAMEHFNNLANRDLWTPSLFFVPTYAQDYDAETDYRTAYTCSNFGRHAIIAFGILSGARVTWLMTTDTRWCPEAGIDNPVFRSQN